MRVLNFLTCCTIIIVAGLAAIWFSKTIYSESISRQLNLIEKDYGQFGLHFERNTTQAGFFNLTDITEVWIANKGDAGSGRIRLLSADNRCTIIPFYITCDVKIDSSEVFRKRIDALIPGLSHVPYQLKSSLNIITSRITTTFDTQTHRIDNEQVNLVIMPLNISSVTTLDMQKNSIAVSWKGARWNVGALFGEITALTAILTNDNQDGYYTQSVTLDGFAIRTAERRLSGNKLLLRSRLVPTSEGRYELIHEFDQGRLVIDHEDNLAVDNILLTLSVSGLDSDAGAIVRRQQGELMFGEPNANELINSLGASMLTVPMQTVSARINGKQVTATGELKVSPFTSRDILTGSLRNHFSGQVHVSAEPGIVRELPTLRAFFSNGITKGYLTGREDGSVAANLVVDKGMVTASGHLLSL